MTQPLLTIDVANTQLGIAPFCLSEVFHISLQDDGHWQVRAGDRSSALAQPVAEAILRQARTYIETCLDLCVITGTGHPPGLAR